MYLKLVAVVLLFAACGARELKEGDKGARQKRLLFYDEEGNLVKTYKNPYSLDLIHNAEKVPFFGSFYNMLRPTLGLPTFYMIPVSDQVIQQINREPIYQNKLLTVPRKDLVIEPNTLCSGKRTQISAKSCRNFLNCWDGWAFEQECPEGLLFAKEGYCDYPNNVDCASRSNAPSPSPSQPQCSKDFEAFRSEQSCSEFFVCVDRTPVKFRCPADLAYNQELGVCDYAYRVNCVQTGQAPSMDESQPSQSNQPIIQPIIPIINQPSNNQPSPPINQPSVPINQPSSPINLPSSPINPPSVQSPSCVQSPSIAPALQTPSGSASASLDSGGPVINDAKSIVTTNSEFNSQTFSSSHIAISRQDAIRQLRH